MTAEVAAPARQAMPVPEAVREAAYRMQVPAGAAAVLWAEREVPDQETTQQANA